MVETYEPGPLLPPLHPHQYRLLQQILGKPGQPLPQSEVLEWASTVLLNPTPQETSEMSTEQAAVRYAEPADRPEAVPTHYEVLWPPRQPDGEPDMAQVRVTVTADYSESQPMWLVNLDTGEKLPKRADLQHPPQSKVRFHIDGRQAALAFAERAAVELHAALDAWHRASNDVEFTLDRLGRTGVTR